MGFLKRLLSVRGKKKRKDDQKDQLARNPALSSSTRTLPLPQQQEAVVNRLLRSTSTHFSVISETNYHDRSMPPIPHPINDVLRAPSIVSSATQTDTYTVTVHRRMLHSRTEFPDANRSGDSSTTPSPTRRHSLPPLTPGDKNRLARLKQDASVLSLLNIYDEKGNPNSRAFSNTPARRERVDSTLHELMGGPSAPDLSPSKVQTEESDISWADRYIRGARRDSSSSTSSTSSLGIPVDLFKSSVSPERLQFQDYDDSETASSSRDMDVGIDSMQVERGTVEDASAILEPIAAALTSPTRRASQFFKFLAEREAPPPHDRRLLGLPDKVTHPEPPSPPPSNSKPIPPSPRGPRPPTATALIVRDGPKQSQTQLSPAPRRRSRPPPLPPVPAQYQSQVTKPLQPSHTFRAPFDALHNAASRSVSVASSVHPQIETQETGEGSDPYTPLPRRAKEGRRGRHVVGENMPPNAPARPVRGQARVYSARDGARPARSKENNAPQVPLPSKTVPNENIGRISKDAPPPGTTPPATPSKNPAHAHLQTPSRPSPASSSELSPHGRQIMASIRAKAKQTPRAWQSWAGKDDPNEA